MGDIVSATHGTATETKRVHSSKNTFTSIHHQTDRTLTWASYG